jgi:hypothetical protein
VRAHESEKEQRMSVRRFLPRVLAGLAFVASAGVWLGFGTNAQTQSAPRTSPKRVSTCPAHSNQISWPDQNPVWTLCWNQPADTTQETDGSGLRLSHIYYKGKKVLERANMPCLNVKYQPPTACDAKPNCCGTALSNHVHTFSYRDWLTQYAPFQANNVLVKPIVEAKDPDHTHTQVAGYAEPTEPVTTLCDVHPNPGKDIGDFYGVAVEKRSDRLVLTTALLAGWYRYTQKWVLHLDGRIEPHFSFTAVDNACTSRPHHHNAYWRLDFDIGDPENDLVEEVNDAHSTEPATVEKLATEQNRLNDPERHRHWRVMDKTSGLGYEIIPGADDGVADDWGVADLWALRYKEDKEQDDGGFRSGQVDGARAHLNEFLDDEPIDGQDVVVWYHGGHLHLGGIRAHCDSEMFGPTLKPVGNW